MSSTNAVNGVNGVNGVCKSKNANGFHVNGNSGKCPAHIRYKAVENIPEALEDDFVFPDLPSKCTWDRSKKNEISPHTLRCPFDARPKVFDNILQAIGMTPMVKLNHIPQSLGIKCQMYAKCEFLNPGGSVKDRIGYRMVLDAEEKGLLKPGSTIIEPTSGNTGIGLAMASAVRGYRCIIVLPEKNSDEKVNTLKALGAEIIRTRTDAKFNDPDSLVAIAQRLQKEIPNSVILNQYTNAGNPLAHYDGTGSEILYQLDHKVDMVVLGAGTGGTVTGIGRKIKEECPECVVVAVDPEGSILARPENMNDNKSNVVVYEVEGIGYDFIPTVLDHTVVDRWVKSDDSMALPMARRLICEEGFLCGGSSGAAMAAAMVAARELYEDQVCVVVCPDNIRNYMTKFVVDNWMEARNLKESFNIHGHSWWSKKVSELISEENFKCSQLILSTSASCQKVLEILRTRDIEQIPIVDLNGKIAGVATTNNLLNKLLDASLEPHDIIEKALFKKFVKISSVASIGQLSRILEKEPFVVVVTEKMEIDGHETVEGIITQKDLLKFLHTA